MYDVINLTPFQTAGAALMDVDQAALPETLEGLLSMSDAEVAALPVPDVVALFALAVSEGLFGSLGPVPRGHCSCFVHVAHVID